MNDIETVEINVIENEEVQEIVDDEDEDQSFDDYVLDDIDAKK